MAADTRLINAAEFFAGDAMAALIESLKEIYDYIIIDLSPIAPVVDVRATSHLIDLYSRRRMGTHQH